ncbi:MAG: 2-oxoacid:acceptor oxidoreductase subunit alpha [SAR324 cluster bacterium]|nr:2-oxoacid:acceptor oxidoreductase subunit alpha [SAR324 cluster bacterium]
MNEPLKIQELDKVVIRFSGDSGDGMQLTGNQFTGASAHRGNDVVTLPDFPAEIRATPGTIPGISGFQMQFGDHAVNTPGDFPDVLVAMNPAALRANIKDVKKDGFVITDSDTFTEAMIKKAGYADDVDPLDAENVLHKQVIAAPITSQTIETLKDFDIDKKSKARCKNFFTLGILFWLYDISPAFTIQWLKGKFAKKPMLADMNIKVLNEGMLFAQNSGHFQSQYRVQPADLKPGMYRSVTGNEACGLGLVAASNLAGLDLFLGSYPITPATTVLEEVAKYKDHNVKAVQMEDEIAGVCSAIGAAWAGYFACTNTSGPGIALKGEALGLAVITEIPLVVINVQRGGPSTGLPTKTEQSDLMQAMYGRNGESPMPVLAAKTPADCFHMTIEASRIALKYMTPVILLTDGYLGNGSEPFLIPDEKDLPVLKVTQRTDPKGYQSYARDPETLAREWVKPGTPGLANRVGGLEKDITGAISHDPENHDEMVRLRAKKVQNIENDIADLEVLQSPHGDDILIIGWGSTYGSIRNSVDKYQKEGKGVSQAHFSHIFPFPKNTGDVLKKYKKIVVAEMNLGQLAPLLRATYLTETIPLTKIQGSPFTEKEISDVIDTLI